MEQKDFAAMGGRAAWKNVSKDERSRRMKKLANKRWNGYKKLSTGKK